VDPQRHSQARSGSQVTRTVSRRDLEARPIEALPNKGARTSPRGAPAGCRGRCRRRVSSEVDPRLSLTHGGVAAAGLDSISTQRVSSRWLDIVRQTLVPNLLGETPSGDRSPLPSRRSGARRDKSNLSSARCCADGSPPWTTPSARRRSGGRPDPKPGSGTVDDLRPTTQSQRWRRHAPHLKPAASKEELCNAMWCERLF
jgi:hypothetical protein